MSDLQCAATLLLVPVDRTPALSGSLTGIKVAHVWSGPAPDAVRGAETAAAELGVGLTVLDRLQPPEGLRAALAEIADQHRGETVAVVVDHDDAIVEVAIDGDAWAWRRYAPSSSE